MNPGGKKREGWGETEILNYFPQKVNLWGKGKCALSFLVVGAARQ